MRCAKNGTSASVVAASFLALAACSALVPNPTPAPLPSNPDGIPAGQLIQIDRGVQMSADNRTVTLLFIDSPIFPAPDPCYVEYAGWARPAGARLEVAVVLVRDAHPPPGTACAAVGFNRQVEVTLDEAFHRTTAVDRFAGGTVEVGWQRSGS